MNTDAVLRETLKAGAAPFKMVEACVSLNTRHKVLRACGTQNQKIDVLDAWQEIVHTDAVLREALEAGAAPFNTVEAWVSLTTDDRYTPDFLRAFETC